MGSILSYEWAFFSISKPFACIASHITSFFFDFTTKTHIFIIFVRRPQKTGYGSHISASVGFRYFIPEFMRQVAKAMNVFIF